MKHSHICEYLGLPFIKVRVQKDDRNKKKEKVLIRFELCCFFDSQKWKKKLQMKIRGWKLNTKDKVLFTVDSERVQPQTTPQSIHF